MATLSPVLSRLIKSIKIQVPGATEDPIKLEMFNTLDEFCRETKLWRDEIPLVTTKNVQTYEITPTDDGQVHLLIEIKDANGFPVSGSMPVPSFVRLTNLPAGGATLTAKCALAPVDPVDSDGWPVVPDWLIYKYFLGLSSGVLSKLMVHPAKPYSNQTLAVLNLRKFSAAKAGGRADALHENLQGGQRWTFPRGWGGSIRQRGH